MKAFVFDIQRSSFVDGPGIRTTVFFKGCALRCKWCHSPESQSPAPQLMFYKEKCIGCKRCAAVCPTELSGCTNCGKCAAVCPSRARVMCGRFYTEDEIAETVLKDRIFYDTSGGGVTFSGGECLLQTDFILSLAERLKEEEINTAIDTAGFVPREQLEKAASAADIFLYDLKCISEDLHTAGTGFSNKLILENLTYLSENFPGDIIIRIPIIPGFNDSDAELLKMRSFLDGINYKKIELLAYHSMAKSKYEALSKEFTSFPVPDEALIEKCQRILRV